jgi:hypothetical protein
MKYTHIKLIIIRMHSNARVFRFFTVTVPVLFLIGSSANAQHVIGSRSKNDSVPPILYRNSHPSRNTDTEIQERLVALAMGSPLYDASGHQINVADDNLAKAKKVWLNLLTVSAQFNDQDFAKTTPVQSAYVYPKYFFGINIPVGLFFSMGPDIKSGRESVAIARDNQLQLARTIRADVLGKYAQYKMYTDLISVQTAIVDDEDALRKQTEQKFKDGTISIEQYNAVNKAYSADLTQKLNQQLQQDLIRIDLEKMIGVSLETVLNMK